MVVVVVVVVEEVQEEHEDEEKKQEQTGEWGGVGQEEVKQTRRQNHRDKGGWRERCTSASASR